MKKHSLIFGILILVSLLFAACGPETTGGNTGSAASGMPDLGGRTVVVAVENAYPPFNSIDETSGEAIGWDYDVVREICVRLNCVPDFQQAAWDGIFPAMAAGEYDVLADGVTITSERDETVDFSIPYVTIGQVLLVRVDETRVVSDFVADTTTKIGTQLGTTNEIVAKETFEDAQVQSFEDFGGAVMALLSGDIDGIVIDNVTAAGFMGANEGQLKIAGQITSDEQLAFVFPPGSDLLEPFNAALQAMIDDGKLDQLNTQWGLK
jgi:polar amino acid transport system substrate-binding protein